MDSSAGLVVPGLILMIFAYLYLRAMGGDALPREKVAKTFLIGLLGMLIGLFLNFPLRLLDADSPMLLADALLSAIVFATLPGELAKMLTLRYYCQRLVSFDGVVAGMVYGGVAALGFVLADTMVFAAPQLSFISPVRTLIAIPLHVTTGALIGFRLAQQMFFPNSRWTLRKALLFSVIVHGSFNLLWLYPGLYRQSGGSSWLVSYGLPVAGTCLAVSICLWASIRLRQHHEHELIQAMTQTAANLQTNESYLQKLHALGRRQDSDAS